MKHIRNSLKDGILFLEHSGVPTQTTTDFGETIKNGSLCVDTTNQNLYMLKNGVWKIYGLGFNIEDYIPRRGTFINKSVYGDIEFTSNKRIYSGDSQIIFNTNSLVLGYTDTINILDDNNITQKSDAIISITDSTKNIFYNVSTNTNTGLLLYSSNNNKVFSDINTPSNFYGSNNNTINGNFLGIDLTLSSNNNILLNNSLKTIISLSSNNTLNINSFQTSNLTITNLNNSELFGLVEGTTTLFTNNVRIYFKGKIVNSNVEANNNIRLQNVENSTITNNTDVYHIGNIKGLSNSVIENEKLFMLGQFTNVNFTNVKESVFLGKNSNLSNDTIDESFFVNNNGVTSNISKANVVFNTTNRNYTINGNSSIIDDSYYNILFNNNFYFLSQGNFNFITNTETVDVYGNNNFVFTPKTISSGFTGILEGDNNVIFSLESNKNITIGSNNFTFGNITSVIDNDINDGNILLGNIVINASITSNNIVFGAKQLNNINYSGNNNNIILNVDNFDVPFSNTVYLPSKFYSISNGRYGLFNSNNITANRTWAMPDASGTIALLSDVGTVTLANYNDVNGYNDTKAITSKNLTRNIAVNHSSNPNTNELYNGSILSIDESVPTSGNPYRENYFAINGGFRTWLQDRLHERTIPPPPSAVAVAYVLYNSSAPNSGEGSILKPYGSLSVALTTLTTSPNTPKSIIVLDSGSNEEITYSSSITWNKNIELSKGVIIKIKNSSAFDTDGGNPTNYFFNATNGFSLSGEGSFVLQNVGLVSTLNTGDLSNQTYIIENITIYSNMAIFENTQRPRFILEKVTFNMYNVDTLYTNPLNYNATSFSISYDIFSTDTNFSLIYIKNCIFYNARLVVNMNTNAAEDNSSGTLLYGSSSCIGSTFYTNKSLAGVSYITISNVYNTEYNFSSRDNTFDLGNNQLRYAFNVNDNNCVSINDRIIRYKASLTSPNNVDMKSDNSSTMYFYNTIVQAPEHNSVPVNTSILITIPTGLSIA